MLTATSNKKVFSGYQNQQISSAKNSSSPVSKNEDIAKTGTDEVSISRKAQALQAVYDKKEMVLEQNYTSQTQRLESEFVQSKKRLEQELGQKKESLKINLYV
jgi:septin family protein